ncbi:YceI family protein [Massilia glaciei]|uniref:Polyisoprenoid-binding protein n=1 Tax=Massilia glaciei TaxID=1524097 RepID=A0A2U2HH94_9BURK|nr:YceI family protein [Massilia glaciei]PWF45032.1 polyisoprenoid-binding protein [Massilia glaciei]
MKLTRSTAVLTLLALALAAHAAPLKTDPAKSSVSAVFKQMGVSVESKFKKFDAQIDYDAARPDASKAVVEIDTASLDLGDPDMNREVAKKEWFNAAQFPKARFVSSAIKPAGAGQLAVSGKLTIKGRTMEVAFPLTLRSEGGRQVFEGALPIKRLGFNIGDGEWKDTSVVADDVVIKFRVTAGQ